MRARAVGSVSSPHFTLATTRSKSLLRLNIEYSHFANSTGHRWAELGLSHGDPGHPVAAMSS